MNRLIDLRTEKRLTQDDVAKVLNVSRQAYSRYEHGDRELGYTALITLAKFFDVSIDYLLGFSDFYYPEKLKTSITAPALSAEDRELLDLFHELAPEFRETALNAVRLMTGKPQTGISAKKKA